MGQDIRLDISIIILTRPNKGTIALQDLSHHVVNETVLVPNTQVIKLSLVVLLEYFLKYVLEQTVVLFHDRVLCTQIYRPLLQESVLETRVCKPSDTFHCVIHPHAAASTLRELAVYFPFLCSFGV